MSKWELCSDVLPYGTEFKSESDELPLKCPSLTRNCPPKKASDIIYLEKYEKNNEDISRIVLIVTRVTFNKDLSRKNSIDKIYAKETISYGGQYEIIKEKGEKEIDYDKEIQKYHILKWYNHFMRICEK